MHARSTTLFIALFNIMGLGLVTLGWAYGYLGPILQDDISKLSTVCVALLGVAIISTQINAWAVDTYAQDYSRLIVNPGLLKSLEGVTRFPDFLKNKVFLYLGLTGTVIGLSMVVSSMNVGDTPDAGTIKAMIAAMKGSMKTAFYATGVAIVCKVWVEILTYILGNAADQIIDDVAHLKTSYDRQLSWDYGSFDESEVAEALGGMA